MKRAPPQEKVELKDDSVVAVIGGGPAGSFFAIHLLRNAKALKRKLKVVVFERRRPLTVWPVPEWVGCWKGCNYCAGGISPKLNDVLREMDLRIPEEIVQSRIASITIQGFWKNIELEVPAGREMLSVYRGSRPEKRVGGFKNFDCFLLDQALKAGAGLVCNDVVDVEYSGSGKPVVRHRAAGGESLLEADLVIFAAGVNEETGNPPQRNRILEAFKRMEPSFQTPRLRKALIFELDARPKVPASLERTVHFVEYGSRELPLEMCSLVPKKSYLTVVLVGPSVDRARLASQNQEIVTRFLNLPHIRKLVQPATGATPVCICHPNMVVGCARHPFGNRVAAVGDMVTSRLYKDGILSAQRTACALADAVLSCGIDAASLEKGYGPTLDQFRKDNRLAAFVFLLHRLFFSSSVLSRVLYQAVITERKTTPREQRRLEKILWRIASGDDDYREIFYSMLHPATVWSVLTGGFLMTSRNYLTELIFGLRWEGFGRFTTGVAIERLEEKRRQFSQLMVDASVTGSENLEFERMYTIKIGASPRTILDQLGQFGEAGRGYLHPRWVRIRRVAGTPNRRGCIIRYEIGWSHFAFSLQLEQLIGGHLAVYRVLDGFAKGGILIFEVERVNDEMSSLSIYVAFNFPRGANPVSGPFWWFFRQLFPAYMHDVVWNHSLCQLKDIAEAAREKAPSQPSFRPNHAGTNEQDARHS